jgi:hypothetical protein
MSATSTESTETLERIRRKATDDKFLAALRRAFPNRG